MTQQNEIGFLRVRDIIGQRMVTREEAERNKREAEAEEKQGKTPNTKPKRPRTAIEPLYPVCRATWYSGIAEGRFPKPLKAPGGRIALWRRSDIMALITQLARTGEQP